MRYAQTDHAECEEVPLIPPNEANALRYAAGYIPFALKKRGQKLWYFLLL